MLIAFSVFTFAYIENNPFYEGMKHSREGEGNIKIETATTGLNREGYMRTTSIGGLEPGTYRITIDPIGENVTVMLRTATETVERFCNRSRNFGEWKLTLSVDSVIWVGVLMRCSPPINYTEYGEVMKIHYDRVEKRIQPSTVTLLILNGTGGVAIAAYTARIHREERE